MADVVKAFGRSPLTAVALRLGPGADVRGDLESIVRERGLGAAGVVSAVGSVEPAVLRMAAASQPTLLPGKHEIISLVGTLGRGGAHLHCGLAGEDGSLVGGHVVAGCRVYTTLEVILAVLPELAFDREVDSATGWPELVVRDESRRET